MSEAIDSGNETQSIRMDLACDVADIGTWQWDPSTGAMNCNRHMKSIFAMQDSTRISYEHFLASVHPQERGHVHSTLTRTVHQPSAQSMECRVLDPDAKADRWVVMRARAYTMADQGIYVVGTAQDISARKNIDTLREFSMRELEHRMRNVFSVLTSVIALSLRSATTPKQLATTLQARVGALARAHQLLAAVDTSGELTLRQVIKAELGPFDDLGAVSVCGSRIALGNKQAMAMNCIVHELTTNAVKYGALSHPEGQLFIDWTIEPSQHEDSLVLRWKESCGHEVAAPVRLGLGSEILSASAREGLGGNIALDFERDGLRATLTAPMSRLD